LSELLKGRVAKILAPHKIVINIGRNDGVQTGMKFVVYEEGEMINDPETGEPLEKLELVKGTVEVTHLQDKISIAESFEVEKRVYSPLAPIAQFVPREYTVKVKEKLTEAEVEEPKPSPLKVGDLVRQLSP